MKFGVVFPQTEFGNDPAAIRDFAQTAESLGYSHILAYDHVLGANPERTPPLTGPYTHRDPFHELFVLFGYMAAVTERIEFATGILILPQRQTALVAKQAATLDILCQGRQRLGLGIGWNWVEYEALNQNFRTRGRRIEEQVKVLRQLWTQPLVNFDGEWHHIPNAGINPLPIQRPIPLWFGGHADAVLRRVAEMGDGWMPTFQNAVDARPSLDKISANLAIAGRSWQDIGLEAQIWYGDGDPDRWVSLSDDWRSSGATHLSLNTMRCGFKTPAEHLEAIQRFAEMSGLFAS
jgi:probable F420-dependent oxidoreductase